MSHAFDHAKNHAVGCACAKYWRWYEQIIDKARHRARIGVYKETHHILPRAFGGSDDPDNLVDLTYREHFLAHWLLTKLYVGYERRQMVYALHCMTFSVTGRRVAGWQIEIVKRALKREAIASLARRKMLRKTRRQEVVRAAEAVPNKASQIASLRTSNDRRHLSALARELLYANSKQFKSMGRRRRQKSKAY